MTENDNPLDLIDVETNLIGNRDGSLGLVKSQEISSNFLADLADDRFNSSHGRMGEFHKVASIPTFIVEKWMREGFNIYDKNITLKDIVRKLNSDDMKNLMATSRNVV